MDVLSEVVDGGGACLTGESVVDLGDEVVYRLFDKRLKIWLCTVYFTHERHE